MVISRREIRRQNNFAIDAMVILLDKKDIEGFCSEMGGDRIVSWKGRYNGEAVEYELVKANSTFKDQGFVCVFKVNGQIITKNIEGYKTFERALLTLAQRLAIGKKKEWFYNKYVVPYNLKLNERKKTIQECSR